MLIEQQKVGYTMSRLNKRSAIKAIIQAYRSGAFIFGTHMLTENSLQAKRNIRKFGPVNYVSKRNGETIYGYVNETERIRMTQFVTKDLAEPKADPKKHHANKLTDNRQKEIERAIIEAYKNGAQFLIAYNPVNTESDAIRTLRFFGEPTKSKSDDGRASYVVDDLENQVKAVVNIGYPDQ